MIEISNQFELIEIISNNRFNAQLRTNLKTIIIKETHYPVSHLFSISLSMEKMGVSVTIHES